MSKVISDDGTTIAYERSGTGPPVILVDGAMCHRASGPMRGFAAALSEHFAVYAYDRRGRGESGDTQPYAVERELDDLRALVAAAGGTAYGFGISSGAALLIAASAAGIEFGRLALYEPPYVSDRDPSYAPRLAELLSAGRNGDAIALFMTSIGMPADMVAGMRTQPFWPVFEAVAPTLAYDNAVMGDSSVPLVAAGSVTVPTLVAAGGASPANLRAAAKAVAEAVPGAEHRELPGETHDASPSVLGPVLVEFFRG
ncbi:alpha/beta hydrolase [Asanoa ishikariensis]|uniref:Lysophospholipase, alpha-beta hydrolase superfamily n=1 Tax=Asanoa ishikariensis TaxID=137265 RepID=A0A1H3KBM0_9ACTN|nr:alpha/beta hydrolase [Asanoa ishikariensis]GIF70450.1 alpha/beta hydrolase [Asanoa ishikariensis]SDY48964.1 Lysophospholipase, alpha-beta hydrolase superfamily [Asanoa ishikariensis]